MTSTATPPAQPPLPLDHPDATPISPALSLATRDGRITYFLYLDPFDSHPADDQRARRRRIAGFVRHRLASQRQVAAAFGLSPVTVNRIVQAERRHGEATFDKPRKPRRRTAVSADSARRAGRLLAQGQSLRATAKGLDLNPETLRQHVRAGLIPGPPSNASQCQPDAGESARTDTPSSSPSTREQRNRRDAQAPMGMAAHNVAGRVAASLGGLGWERPRFAPARTVARGGVLAALPALLETGLLRHADCLPALQPGYYGRDSILLLAGLLQLARVRNAESLRYLAPGEWGALLGLDRCPEVKCFRRKLGALSANASAVRSWQAALARDWIAADPDEAATLCFDGHVQTYSGQGRLARRFVPRQKLCLPAATTYWLNALGGKPFLCWHKPTDPGLVQAIRDDVLPALRQAGALRPDAPDLARLALPARPALTLVFDREGWSPALFLQLARQGVACITWRKGGTGADWPRGEFRAHDIRLTGPGGERPRSVLLAERPLKLPVGRAHCELREIRRLDDRGHQVALVTTHRSLPTAALASAMLSRWSHENFFRYARAEFGLDTLPTHALVPLAPDTEVVNPRRRDCDRLLNRLRSRRASLRNREGQARDDGDSDAARALHAKGAVLEDAIAALSRDRREIPARIRAGALDPAERLQTLPEPARLLHDTLRMIAYRAETALLPAVAGPPHPSRNPRSALKALFQSDACLLPDRAAGQLRVSIQHLANRAHDRSLSVLIDRLNATSTRFPGTDLRLVYEIAA